jgi:hypothetical protein
MDPIPKTFYFLPIKINYVLISNFFVGCKYNIYITKTRVKEIKSEFFSVQAMIHEVHHNDSITLRYCTLYSFLNAALDGRKVHAFGRKVMENKYQVLFFFFGSECCKCFFAFEMLCHDLQVV